MAKRTKTEGLTGLSPLSENNVNPAEEKEKRAELARQWREGVKTLAPAPRADGAGLIFADEPRIDVFIKQGFLTKEEVPPPEKCRFCGRERHWVGAAIGRDIKNGIAWAYPEVCECAESIEKYQRDKAERKARETAKNAEEERRREEEYRQRREEREEGRRAERERRESAENPFGYGLILSGDLRVSRRADTPPPVACEFCGAERYTKGIAFGREIRWNPLGADACGCPKGREKAETEERARQEREEKKKLDEEERERRKKIRGLRRNSGMGEALRQKLFGNFLGDTERRVKIKEYMTRYAENFRNDGGGKNSVFIFGGVGTGKTHISAAASNFLIEGGAGVICASERDLLGRIRHTYGSGEKEDESVILAEYRRIPLLVIDDLGKEKASDWTIATLYAIIDGRYNEGKPVIITSNYSPDELVSRLTPGGGDETTARALVDRLAEMCEVIVMDGKSMRRYVNDGLVRAERT